MRFIRLLDYFFVLRPILFFPGWTTTLAGYLTAQSAGKDFPPMATSYHLILVIFSSAMVMSAGFTVNQWKDIETDRANKKLFFLSEDVLNRRTILLETIVLILGALVIAASISANMLIIHAVSLFLITVVYNLWPFNLKDKTFGSFLANLLMGVFAFMYGWFLIDVSLLNFLMNALPYILFNTSLYFLTTIPDLEGDKRASKRTIAVVYGFLITVYWAVAFEIAALIAALILADWFMLIISGLTLPFYVILLTKRNVPSVIFTVKFGLLFFSLAVGVYFPWYLVVIILFFFVTRWYYRKRFGMTYPNFRGE